MKLLTTLMVLMGISSGAQATEWKFANTINKATLESEARITSKNPDGTLIQLQCLFGGWSGDKHTGFKAYYIAGDVVEKYGHVVRAEGYDPVKITSPRDVASYTGFMEPLKLDGAGIKEFMNTTAIHVKFRMYAQDSRTVSYSMVNFNKALGQLRHACNK